MRVQIFSLRKKSQLKCFDITYEKLFLKNGWIDRSTLKKIKYIIILVACKLGLGGKSSLSRKIFKYLLSKTFSIFSIGFQSNLINFPRVSKTKSSLFTLHHVQINIWKRCFEDVFSNPVPRYPETLPRAKRGGNFVQA